MEQKYWTATRIVNVTIFSAVAIYAADGWRRLICEAVKETRAKMKAEKNEK